MWQIAMAINTPAAKVLRALKNATFDYIILILIGIKPTKTIIKPIKKNETYAAISFYVSDIVKI